MRYWWVNQNQTFQAERSGGYLWSPKRNRNGNQNPFYENMREVAPGDLIFSFRDGLIPAVSIATTFTSPAPRPVEFGSAGEQWDSDGWRVNVSYTSMPIPVRPKDHMAELAPLLPDKYSPLQPNGNGLQSVYLAEIPEPMANKLIDLLEAAGNTLPPLGERVTASNALEVPIVEREDSIEQRLRSDPTIPDTERTALVKSRRGQGLFRDRVQQIEGRCRLSGINDLTFLVAGHIKPWRVCTNMERLDGENGLLLTPTFDRLFDQGFIGFEDNGDLLVSPVLSTDTARRLGLPLSPLNVGPFAPGQRQYLGFHRNNVLKRAE